MRRLNVWLGVGMFFALAACQSQTELPQLERSALPEAVWDAIDGRDIDPRSVSRSSDGCYYEAVPADFELVFNKIYDESDRAICD